MQNTIPSGSAASRTVGRTLERRRAVYEDEVRRLLDAAFSLIEETGELEPKVSEIVRRAGLSNQAFYKHFRSKRELLVAVLDEGVRLLAGYLEHRMGTAQSPTDRIREWLLGLLEQALNPDAAAATRPFARSRERLAEAYLAEVAESERRVTALVQRALRDARAVGQLPGVDPEADAEMLYRLAMGWLQGRLAERAGAERADAARLVDFALHGLRRGGARA